MRNLKEQSGFQVYELGLILAVLVCCLMLGTLSVWGKEARAAGAGGEQRVFDEAGLFKDSEIKAFEVEIANSQKQMKADIVVVTAEDTGEKSTQAFADDFFDQGGFGYGEDRNGVLFLIDMDNRQLTLSTSGSMIRILTDQRIETILDHVSQGVRQNNYTDSVEQFLTDVVDYHRKGIQSNQYNYDTETGNISVYRSIRWYEALLSLGVSAFTGIMVCVGIVSRYSMKKERRRSAQFQMAYRADSKFVFHGEKNNLVHKYVTTTIVPRNTSPPGGGGSAGRSSTHTSSSGRSHGGGSRGF